MEVTVKTINEIKAEIAILNDKKNSLIQQQTELKEVAEKNRTSFREWLTNNFKHFDHSTDYVDLKDKKFIYSYNLEDGILKMVKKSRNHRGGFGFHPMNMYYDQMLQKMEEEKETFYEGNKAPEKPTEIDLYETLKNDILNNGEISSHIKKYIGEDRTMRQKLETKLSNEIYDIEKSISTITQQHFNENFTLEKIKKLFSEKTTFTNGEYTLRNNYKSVTFKKETAKQYQIEITKITDQEITFVDKIDKRYFNIKNYITL